MGTANLIYGIAVGMAICTTIIYWQHTLEMNELRASGGPDKGLISKQAFKKMVPREDAKRLRSQYLEKEPGLDMNDLLAVKDEIREQGERLKQEIAGMETEIKRQKDDPISREAPAEIKTPAEIKAPAEANIEESEEEDEATEPPGTTADAGSEEELDEDEQQDVAQFHNKDEGKTVPDFPNINGYKLDSMANKECPNGIDISYWNQLSDKDVAFKSPFGAVGPELKFVTFEPDHGGWNNIRMAMETVMVFAHATDRILVMPPDMPLYLLNKDKSKATHGFADFFHLDAIHESGSMQIIQMEDFLNKYAKTGKLPKGLPDVLDHKLELIYDKTGRNLLWDYLREIGEKPKWDPFKVGCVIPSTTENMDAPIDPSIAHVQDFLTGREAVYYYKEMRDATVVHFPSNHKLGYRYLTHFYTFIYFVDDWTDRFYKRFIRDTMHYREDIFCAASCVVRKLWEETGGSYSSAHVRRGDFQYKAVRLPGKELFENSKDHYHEGETIYIATDERDKSVFKDFNSRYTVRYLDDYIESCNLNSMNKNYFGMIDQIVSSYGRIFFGTWFSTFTGYITRMRGYLGMENRSNWYFFLPKKESFQHHDKEWWPDTPFYKREWPVAWSNIDEVDQ